MSNDVLTGVCALCKKRKENLVPHHKYSYYDLGRAIAIREGKVDVWLMILVCKNCHYRVHRKGVVVDELVWGEFGFVDINNIKELYRIRGLNFFEKFIKYMTS